jgi:hypothetical protein
MTKLEKLCIKWLNENYNPMEPFIMEEYPDYVFHMKDGKCILQYNKKNGYVYVSYREIWKFFESFFSMDNQQIKDITKIWVEEHYKVGVTSTSVLFPLSLIWVEEHYKVGVTSTAVALNSKLEKVEEHYKEITIRKCVITDGEQLAEREYKKIKTTKGEVFWLVIKVEGQYKMNVTTTNNQNDFYFEREVEELYNQHTNG